MILNNSRDIFKVPTLSVKGSCDIVWVRDIIYILFKNTTAFKI